MKFTRLLLAASAGLLLAAPQAFAGGTDQLSAFLKGIRSASGAFTQETFGRSGQADGKVFSGDFVFSRPGKFVWTYEKPYRQVISSNGKTVSVWDPDLRQVTVRSLAASVPSSPVAILFGNNDFRKDFTVKDLPAEKGAEWLEAVPKSKDSSFTSFRIGFRDALPVAMELHDSFGQTMKLEFSNLKKNPAVPASRFEFVPPKGAEILRQ